MLIASDGPEVLDPLEVKHSEGGRPYASHRRVGWAVNGPLVPYPHCSPPSSFFVKADTELHQMVQDSFNRLLLLNDYKDFVQDIVAKGYAQKVPEHRKESDCQGNTCFIPHHRIYHPHKPGKIRVVFDCSARFKGTSLNDLLLKGPDLTNSLLGVLTRFRQDRVAVMADIEEMFHQVRVPECDHSFLRFLRWPNCDLSRGLIEYQMTVHLFGAVSSPACSNYALRKTADDSAQHFSCDVVNTIKWNFYVDDCLKSLPSVKDAITHVRELCSLLQQGGFRLTKWMSSSREVLESIPVKAQVKKSRS